MTVVAEKKTLIELPPLKISTMRVTLIGDSPLISHRWAEKAKKEMLDKQMKKAKRGKDAKDPFRDFVDSLYWLSEKPSDPTPDDMEKGKFGFPVVAFKAAAVDACSHVDGVTKVEARGAFHLAGEFAKEAGNYWPEDHFWTEDPGGVFHVSTGGWSGNEDIIGAMSENFICWTQTWVSHHRGGHYEFKLPPVKG